jgi:hypothetical protein
MTRFLHLWVWLWFVSSPIVFVVGADSNDMSAVVLAFMNVGMPGAFLCLLRKMDE